MFSLSLLDKSILVCYHLLDDDFIIHHDERLFKWREIKIIILIYGLGIFY